MAFLTAGSGAGEIKIDLNGFGLSREDQERVCTTVKAMAAVSHAEVKNDGWLEAKVKPQQQLSDEKWKNFMSDQHAAIIKVAKHKAESVNKKRATAAQSRLGVS